jgi:hypothetical protein
MNKSNRVQNNSTQLNIVMAFIGLCLGFTNFLPNESVNRILQFLFGDNSFDISVNQLILLIVGFVSSAGTLWFLISQSEIKESSGQIKQLLPHIFIPVLTSVTLAYTLSQMVRSPLWWLVYLLGLALVGVVLVAEKADLINTASQSPIPVISLTSLSIGLFLLVVIVLRTIGPRLYVLIPTIGLAAGFVSFRFISLRLRQKPFWELITAIVLIVAQLAAALYYLFINALQFGLILTGVLYFLVTLSVGYQNQKKGRALLVEPLSMLVIALVLTGLTLLF